MTDDMTGQHDDAATGHATAGAAAPGMSRRHFMHGTAAVAAATALVPAARGKQPAGASSAGGQLAERAGAAPSAAAQTAPFVAGETATAWGSTTATVPITAATSAGDAIVLFVSTNNAKSGQNSVVSITDSGKKNAYKLAESGTNGTLGGWAYVCAGGSALPKGGSITVTFNEGGAHQVIAVDVPGGGAADLTGAASATGSSATPTVTTKQLAGEGEVIVALAANANATGENSIAWSTDPFQPVGVYGGGTLTMAALSGTGLMAAGGDVEGYFTTSNADGAYGDHWTVSNTGVNGQYWRRCAALAWARMPREASPATTVYACCGDGKEGGGGFLASTDGGASWTMRSTGAGSAELQFAGNDPDFSLATRMYNCGGWPRSTGNLIAQDPAGGYLYAATWANGVYRSRPTDTVPGTNWDPIAFPATWTTTTRTTNVTYEAPYFCRSMVMDPRNPGTLYVAAFDKNNQGVLWTTASANTSSVTWTAVETAPTSGTNGIEELAVVGNSTSYVVYAACGTNGVWWATISHAASGPWKSLNHDPVSAPASLIAASGKPIASPPPGGTSPTVLDTTAGPYWFTLTGYVDSATGNHVVIASCDQPDLPPGCLQYRNLVQFEFSTSSQQVIAGGWSDVTASPTSTIHVDSIPPDGSPWWHAGATEHDWLGGSAWVNGHVTVDSTVTPATVFATGSNGFYRGSYSEQSQAWSWELAINGLAIFNCGSVAVDPVDPEHIIFGDPDWCSWDVVLPTAGAAGSIEPSEVPRGQTKPVAPLQGYVLAFDPRPTNTEPNIYISAGEKYANANGAVFSRNSITGTSWSPDPSAFTPTFGGGVAVGLAVGRESGGGQFVLAAVAGSGMWRYDGSSWKPVAGAVAAQVARNDTSYLPLILSPSSETAYVLDRAAGVLYRGTGYGTSWQALWKLPKAVTDSRTGFLAVNPASTSPDELWISCTGQLWKLTSASTVTAPATPQQVTGGGVPAYPGALAFSADGTLYCLSLGAVPPVARSTQTSLARLLNGGTTWTDVSGPAAPGVAACASRPQNMVIGSDNRIYIANDANLVAQGFPAGGWTPLASEHTGSAGFSAAAWQTAGSTTPVTAAGQVSSAPWVMLAVPITVTG